MYNPNELHSNLHINERIEAIISIFSDGICIFSEFMSGIDSGDGGSSFDIVFDESESEVKNSRMNIAT